MYNLIVHYTFLGGEPLPNKQTMTLVSPSDQVGEIHALVSRALQESFRGRTGKADIYIIDPKTKMSRQVTSAWF